MSTTGAAGRSPIQKKMIGFMLAHEQFTVPELVELGGHAIDAGFGLLATSDHFQPWQANEAHSGLAWVTMGALGGRAGSAWIGTTVTCPILRYHPAVVAEAFATLSQLYPGRVFLGVGSGEALNEKAATGQWPDWNERWERLIEAIGVIRELWSGASVSYKGKHYTVEGRLYDTPSQPIPLLTAANGPKAMRLAGLHGDGLVTDPKTWKEHKSAWQQGVRESGRDPSTLAVLVEQFVVVGEEDEAKESATLWRFIPKAFKKYHKNADPAAIQREAETELSLEQVYREWPRGTDPATHAEAIENLFESGATIVNIHSGQSDQKKVIDFYGRSVLPKLRRYLH